MEIAYTEITLDINKENYAEVHAKQYDADSRGIIVSVISNGLNFPIPDTANAYLRAVRPDKTPIFNNCVVENRKITYVFTSDLLYIAGKIPVDFVITDDGKILSTMKMKLIVHSAAGDDNFDETGETYDKLQAILNDCSEMVEITTSEIDSSI